MIAPGMLQNPAVRAWLGGVELAWTLLDQASFDALRRPPSAAAGEVRLATNLTWVRRHSVTQVRRGDFKRQIAGLPNQGRCSAGSPGHQASEGRYSAGLPAFGTAFGVAGMAIGTAAAGAGRQPCRSDQVQRLVAHQAWPFS
jgi:hypothetical protein